MIREMHTLLQPGYCSPVKSLLQPGDHYDYDKNEYLWLVDADFVPD